MDGRSGPERLARIADYNEDDVRATLALRGWLIEQRPDDLPWRDPALLVDEPIDNFDEQIDALHEFEPGTPEHLLGDLLGYWPREGSTHKAQTLARLDASDGDLVDEPTVITGLQPVSLRERSNRRSGAPITPAMDFTFEPQELTSKLQSSGAKVMFPSLDGLTGFSGVVDLDASRHGVARLVGVLPGTRCVADVGRAQRLGVTESEARCAVRVRRRRPRSLRSSAIGQRACCCVAGSAFTPGGGPTGGRFDEDLDEMRSWVRELDHSCVAIQGPPGTGKTFRGAHVVHSLLMAGQRVGITAFSHAAIANFSMWWSPDSRRRATSTD